MFTSQRFPVPQSIHMGTYAELPDQVQRLLTSAKAPPRLIAHLTLVHDAALELTAKLKAEFPELQFDRQTVLFGAATHDIGKLRFLNELTGPGSMHEEGGAAILAEAGVPDSLSRFARTHSAWSSARSDDRGSVGYLVGQDLERQAARGSRADAIQPHEPRTRKARVEVFASMDAILSDLAADGVRKLVWQSSFPISRSEARPAFWPRFFS